MKLKKLNVTNHPILGNLELDFTDERGKAVDTIILAGENGCGKTAILRTIYDLTVLTADFKGTGAEQMVSGVFEFTDRDKSLVKSFISEATVAISFAEEFLATTPDIIMTLRQIGGGGSNFDFSFANGVNYSYLSNFVRSILKSIFSEVEINFNPSAISSVTAKNVDEELENSIRTNSNLATDITQLLVDIQALDDSEFSLWMENNIDNIQDKTKEDILAHKDVRTKRFKEGFSAIFPNKKFKQITNIGGNKKVIFEEFGKDISIENLSSGEKQIVFRGSFLLKDQKSSKAAIILIDEPEISLHPNWQINILDFFKKLFTDEKGIQTSQIIIATHSPFIIHNENRYNDKVIILAKDAQGQIYVRNEGEFYGWTKEKIVKEAFEIDLATLLSTEKVMVFVEGTTDIDYIIKAAELLGRTDTINKISLKDGGGDNLRNLWSILTNSTSEIFTQNALILHDCDVNLVAEEKRNLFRNKIERINRKYIKNGIENLFPDSLIEAAIENKKAFIDIIPAPTIRGEKKGDDRYQLNIDEKRNLCEWICQNATKDDFRDFEKVFEIIEKSILK